MCGCPGPEPVIFLFTDFGWNGPYVGEMHAVLARQKPSVPVIDLMHDAPAFAPKPAGYLLAALSRQWSAGDIVVAVVDPGVGSPRKPLAVKAGDCWLVGPDNGLLVPAARRLGGPAWYEIVGRPRQLSASFHGRDVFAPMAASLAQSNEEGLAALDSEPVGLDWPEELAEIIYQDAYGNLVTGLRPAPGRTLRAGIQRFPQARTFADMPPGVAFWYENSMGLTEIAVNRGTAAAILELLPGDAVSWN